MRDRGGFLFLSIIILALLNACMKENPAEAVPVGAFQYRAYDTNGTLIIQGWMTLNTSDSAHVRGEWHFNKVGNPSNIGPHFGDDSLSGGFYQSRLSLNLNRQFADNNVILIGEITNLSFKGDWKWIGFPGQLNHGTFEAVK